MTINTEDQGRELPTDALERIRVSIRAEEVSYGELAELQGLAAHIDPSDVELLEWAGVPEFDEEKDANEITITDWVVETDTVELFFDTEAKGEYLCIMAHEGSQTCTINLDPDGVDQLRAFLDANRGR